MTDYAKLRQLVLYLCRSSEGDERFGLAKLNKLLFYSDFNAFVELGSSITGVEYVKLEHGPAPNDMRSVLGSMTRDGQLAIREENYYGYDQKRPLALRSPDLSSFSATQLDLVVRQIRRFWNHSAVEISAESHEFCGWRHVSLGEPIPYVAALIQQREPTSHELELGAELSRVAARVFALARNIREDPAAPNSSSPVPPPSRYGAGG